MCRSAFQFFSLFCYQGKFTSILEAVHRCVTGLKGAACTQEPRCAANAPTPRQKEKAALILKALIRQQGMKSRGPGSEAVKVGRQTLAGSSIQRKRVKYENIGYHGDAELLIADTNEALVDPSLGHTHSFCEYSV